jgi:excisionase family DNA binding protein
MTDSPMELEELLLAVLAADDSRRRAALRILRGEYMEPTATEGMDGPLLMRMGDAARYLGVSRCTLWRMVKEGRLEQVELRRGSYRLRKADLDRLAARRAAVPK